jgi:hypothetical protein
MRWKVVCSGDNILLAKCFLCLLNFLLLLAGSGVLFGAIWAAWNTRSFIDFTRPIEDEELRTRLMDRIVESPVVNRIIHVTIAAGASMLCASCLSCRGLVRESRRLLDYYGVTLLIFLVMEIAAGCLATGYAYKAEKGIKAAMTDSLQQYRVTAIKEMKTNVTLMWDRIFTVYDCCGVNDYKDFWRSTEPFDVDKLDIPETCCYVGFEIINNHVTCKKDSQGIKHPHYTGCYDAIFDVLMKNINIVIGIISGLVLSEFFGIILAWSLRESILKRNSERKHKRRWLLTEELPP